MHKGINTTVDEGQTPIVAHSLRAEGFDASEDGTGRGTPLVPVAFQPRYYSRDNKTGGAPSDTVDITNCHKAGDSAPAIGWSEELTPSIECAGTIQRGGDGGRHEGVMTPAMQVRRLTPRECERLQGFPDDYTLIPFRGKPAADGNRYKALGNSMAVNVMSWIGSRLDQASRTEKV